MRSFLLLSLCQLATAGPSFAQITGTAAPVDYVPALWGTGATPAAVCTVGTQVATFTISGGSGADDTGLVTVNGNQSNGTITFSGAGGMVYANAYGTRNAWNGGEYYEMSATDTTFTAVENDAGASVDSTGSGTARISYPGSGVDSDPPYVLAQDTDSYIITNSTSNNVAYTMDSPASNTRGFVYVLAADCDEDGVASVAGGGTDIDDQDACRQTATDPSFAGATVLYTASLTTTGLITDLDCDGDGTTVGAGDSNDADVCVNPAYDPSINMPGGTPDDCDGDGFLASVDDPDDADECNPTACARAAGDPTPETSAVEQASAASEANGFLHRHMQNELRTSGQQNLSVVLSANEISGVNSSGVNWYSAGVTATETGGGTNGEGIFVYATTGFDRHISETSISGFIVGAEYGEWAYADQPDAEKLGVSVGAYAGRKIGSGVSVTGTVTYTHFFNDYTNLTGDTGSMQSDRIMASVGINGLNELANGTRIKPYADVTFAVEELEGFTYSNGDAVEASTADFGEASVGLEVTTPFNAEMGQFFFRMEASQSLTTEDTLLIDGSTFSPYDDATGAFGIGWVSNGGTDNVGRIELSVTDLGNPGREEVTLSGHWERYR